MLRKPGCATSAGDMLALSEVGARSLAIGFELSLDRGVLCCEVEWAADFTEGVNAVDYFKLYLN